MPACKPRSRRLGVVLCAFLPALGLGLAYTILRPAAYQATARLEITPASATPASVVGSTSVAATTGQEARSAEERGSQSFLREVQVLTSRPLIEEVVER